MSEHVLKAAYLEDWMDTIESLPLDLQRNFTLLRELDAEAQGKDSYLLLRSDLDSFIDLLKDVDDMTKEFLGKASTVTEDKRRKMLKSLEESFNNVLKHGESKVTLAIQTYDMVDKQIRRLDDDLIRFEEELTMTGPRIAAPHHLQQQGNANNKRSNGDTRKAKRRNVAQPTVTVSAPSAPASVKRERRTFNSLQATVDNDMEEDEQQPATVKSTGASTSKEQNITHSLSTLGGQASVSDSIQPHHAPSVAIPAVTKPTASSKPEAANENDPNEPTYCICNQVSYGAMVGCDNPECDIEWFHYECVGLDAPPKGKWYCSDCKDKYGF
ncbi:hypothetical protein MP638_000632 [Amoeboaphelidium occidentale]|nr:hypothetical protein MP638_000632 [Amoeboaphelidium occidentale]